MLDNLNFNQRAAATTGMQHTLLLAGAGSGKTRTIIARAAHLISTGFNPRRIRILTFTRRSAAEIVERVKNHLGEREAEGLKASTFHTWAMTLIRRAPNAFGAKYFTVIDRDDALQLFRLLRGNKRDADDRLPTAAQLADIYSYARNTGNNLTTVLEIQLPEHLKAKETIADVLRKYEKRKAERKYLDYDDILALLATQIEKIPDVCNWVSAQYDTLLVDEFQDTNPLQWRILNPLSNSGVTLFCVGDDAQSIYGFRGADFKNVHSFNQRVPNSQTLRLTINYRSYQEILDISNWLLQESPISYNKNLEAARGASGRKPQLHTFSNEWAEARFVVDDISRRYGDGGQWRDHMILCRSSFAGRAFETVLLEREIPYVFVGGAKLLESSHVRDVLAALRIVANPKDEIALLRYMSLFPGCGEKKSAYLATLVMECLGTLDESLRILANDAKTPAGAVDVLYKIRAVQWNVAEAIRMALMTLMPIMEVKYKNNNWDKRKNDFIMVEKLAENHSSISGFIEEYLLDPVSTSEVRRLEDSDKVTVITVHSAKGAESKICYIVGSGPGTYPSIYAVGDKDKIEEERRVLYVALTRAQDDLYITRNRFVRSSVDDDVMNTYFFNSLPDKFIEEFIHNDTEPTFYVGNGKSVSNKMPPMGIDLS